MTDPLGMAPISEEALKKAKKETKKKKAVKKKTCADCKQFSYMKTLNLDDYTLTTKGTPTGRLLCVLEKIDFYNLTAANYMTNFAALFPTYEIRFLPYPRCSESPFAKKATDSVAKLCEQLYILVEVRKYDPDLVLLTSGTKRLLRFAEKGTKISFPGNWGWYNEYRVYAMKNLYDIQNGGMSQENMRHTQLRVDRYFKKKLFWQRDLEIYPVRSIKELNCWREEILAQDVVAFDFETTGLDQLARDFHVKTLAIAWPRKAVCIAYEIDGIKDVRYLKAVREFVAELSEKKDLVKVAHNLRFEQKTAMSAFNIGTFNNWEDTMFMSYLWDETRAANSLKYLAGMYFDGYEETPEDFASASFDELFKYNGIDAFYTLKLRELIFAWEKADPKIREGLEYVYKKVMLPLCRELAELELAGAQLDYDYLEKSAEILRKRLQDIHEKINTEHPQAQGKNLNSNKQLGDLLYVMLRYPVVKRTKTGASTDKEALSDLRDNHGCTIAADVLEMKKLTKQLNTYVTPYLEKREQYVGDRIRASYAQTKNNDTTSLEGQAGGTVTGRLSSANPNLQNIPRDKVIKNNFVPTKIPFNLPTVGLIGNTDRVYLEADLSQAELRISASLAFEENMLQVYREDGDIHYTTGMSVTPEEQKRAIDTLSEDARKKAIKEIRQIAKPVNFGLIYGGSHLVLQGMARMSYGITLSEEEARRMRNAFFRTYPQLTAWHEAQKQFAIRNKYVVSPYGRLRQLKDLATCSPDSQEYGRALRIAINSPVQGSCADFLAQVWTTAAKQKRRQKLDAFGALTVHDSVIFDVAKTDVWTMIHLLTEATEYWSEVHNRRWLQCPMKMDFAIGKAWGDTVELGDITAAAGELTEKKLIEYINEMKR